jgi:hypothetical protein
MSNITAKVSLLKKRRWSSFLAGRRCSRVETRASPINIPKLSPFTPTNSTYSGGFSIAFWTARPLIFLSCALKVFTG